MNNSELLFVTSFSTSMYEEYGRNMVESWLQHSDENMMLYVYSENFDTLHIDSPKIKILNLYEDPWLNTWLLTNGHRIPKCYGGLADHDDKEDKEALWAKKTSAIYNAFLSANSHTKIIWLDCDLIVTGCLKQLINTNIDICYIAGWKRKKHKIIDTSVLVLTKCKSVETVITVIRKTYDSMATKWKTFKIRSDGHVLAIVLNDLIGPEYVFPDSEFVLSSGAVCKDVCNTRTTGDALLYSDFGSIIIRQSGPKLFTTKNNYKRKKRKKK
ncbi:hypothetical protein TetV_354 [Tetraselmis virus 1]|uniref:Uncharacterized protein n=1 Tax=Tetraselmis virus 1 TaxID=2060617 RepID=A0A2P0VNG1_9VIRU|nr:hypothetical protein QJ968_gp354 [Tetraselmis virus 1]AUF82446.1 hypothetical protein TetV_354 [Tetraselmis virus 1]